MVAAQKSAGDMRLGWRHPAGPLARLALAQAVAISSVVLVGAMPARAQLNLAQYGYPPPAYGAPAPYPSPAPSYAYPAAPAHPPCSTVTPGPLRGAARGAALGAVGGAIGGDAGKGAAIGAGVGGVGGAMRRGSARASGACY